MDLTRIGFARIAAVAATLCLATVPARAATTRIAGVWQARAAAPGAIGNPVASNDAQTLTLTDDGHYSREMVAQGGPGTSGAGGTTVDRGRYRFTPPSTFRYHRESWTVCAAAGCGPSAPSGPSDGTLRFALHDPKHASFIGLGWTKTR